MDLKDLQSTWDKYSSTQERKNKLEEDDFQVMLKKRTKTLIENIDRKVKIGITIMVILTFYFIIDDFILGPQMAKSEGISLPSWIFWLDTLTILFIIISFVSFVQRYYYVQKEVNHQNDLKILVRSILRLMKTYKVMFYLALVILLLTFGVSYVTGMFAGIELSAYRQGVSILELDRTQAFQKLAVGLFVILSIIAVVFLLVRWGFRKLYGKHVAQLESTLKELEEVD